MLFVMLLFLILQQHKNTPCKTQQQHSEQSVSPENVGACIHLFISVSSIFYCSVRQSTAITLLSQSSCLTILMLPLSLTSQLLNFAHDDREMSR